MASRESRLGEQEPAAPVAGGGALVQQRQRGIPSRARPRRNASYELFVLGELMNGPMRGYLLREILNRALGPYRTLSWGVLYPLIHALEREGLIAAESPRSLPDKGPGSEGATGRERRAYRLTDAGRERFHRLMRERRPDAADYDDLLLFKLNLSVYSTLEDERDILVHHAAHLRTAVTYLQSQREFVMGLPDIPAHERPYILRVLGYRLSGLEAQLAFIEAELARRSERSSGSDAPNEAAGG